MNPSNDVQVVRSQTLLTLQAAKHLDLERLMAEMSGQGWKLEHFPRFEKKDKVWQVTLSRSQPVALNR
ncbi:hypothetical protein EDC14_105723 [Hydrogenispora ethanolica]|uniref:DUF4177 domain-containing protein n=1 Tax=Hydrogenispora ethanolica TaxID=1082276 RepID=A0A4R1QRY5_HYDET|nr:hypothetical protein [Hydrogenispora ethanolica]TCL55155.1 hypothetical protein EDC14_105723 [Hydrogenispora ethanolica]